MTLQRIDDALTDWNRRLEAIANNLLWLQAQSTYQLLTGPAKISLTGATGARVQPPLDSLPSLFQNFDLLNSTIERAVEARKALPTLFGADQKIVEIEQILFGKSIKLPIVDVPLEQRTLLGQAHSTACLSPEELLAPMPGLFAAARDAVLTVERAWQDLATRVARAEAQAEALRQQAAGIGITPALDDVARTLARLGEQYKTDPLGALDTLASEVQPALDNAARAIKTMLQARREIEQARAHLDGLRDLHRESVTAAEEARAKIADCAGLPAPFDERRIAYLAEWLDRVANHLRSGTTEPFATELRNWKASAGDCTDLAKKVHAANRAPVEARRELRGRLDALKAKARARGIAESAEVAALAKKAETLLATRPTQMAQAEEAVAAYARALNGGRQ